MKRNQGTFVLMGVAAALMVMLIFPQTLWAPYGGIGGVPVPQELEDLTDVEASSLASDQDAVVWNSATQSYIHTAVSGGSGDMTKAVYDADNNSAIDDTAIPDDITIDLAATATALAADGANCAAGNYPLGVDASGAVQDCTALGGGGDMTKAVYDADNNSAIDDTAIPAEIARDSELFGGNFSDLAGNITDAQTPDDITVDLASEATALAANGANCAAGSIPLGVDASGAVEGCYASTTFESALEGVMDLEDMQGTATSAQIAADMARDSEVSVAAIDAGVPLESRTIGGTALTAHTLPIHKAGVDITITDFGCITDTGTVVFELLEGSGTGYTGGTTVDGTITCDTNEQQDDGTLANGTIDANDYIAARFGTETSSPTIVQIWWKYTVD